MVTICFQTCWNVQLRLLKEEDNLVDLSNVLLLLLWFMASIQFQKFDY